jgi:hypothetical protein
MQRYRHEIWQANEEPELALLCSWDTEAILTVEPRRFDTGDGPSDYSRGSSQQHMRALIGASRAAINQQVAFEYLSETEILAGIAAVYPTIYLLHVRACSVKLLEALLEARQRRARIAAWQPLPGRSAAAVVERCANGVSSVARQGRPLVLHQRRSGPHGDLARLRPAIQTGRRCRDRWTCRRDRYRGGAVTGHVRLVGAFGELTMSLLQELKETHIPWGC